MNTNQIKTNYPALYTLVTIFFFWGFIASGNSIFIPFCKHFFKLDQFQSQLVDFAFYGAYYLGALLLLIFSFNSRKDLISQWGYKKSIVYGLLFSCMGAIIMIFAMINNSFSGMLLGLFIVALGFSLQQTAAQPFAILLGDPATGNTRINLGGGINSFGTMIGPLIVAFSLFGSSAAVTDEMISKLDLTKVVILYIVVGILFIAAASLFSFSKSVPDKINNEKVEKSYKALFSLLTITILLIITFLPVFSSYHSKEANEISNLEKIIEPKIKHLNYLFDKLIIVKHQKISFFQKKKFIFLINKKIKQINTIIQPVVNKIEIIKKPLERYRMYWLSVALFIIISGLLLSNYLAQKNPIGWGAMRYPQLVLGMLAIFIYVGVEVAIGSNIGELLKRKEFGGYSSADIAPFISMYWGSLMIGRWAGSISAFSFHKKTKKILIFIIPITAFMLILFSNSLAKYNISELKWYILCVFIQIFAFYLSEDKPIKSLLIFGILGVIAMIVGMSTTGIISVYSFLSGGLFCSILWPCIFTLSIAGLGKYTSQGSAFLIMMVLGGGIIPPIQGKLSDIIGIHYSFIVNVLCFAYLAFFAWIIPIILKKQGVMLENNSNLMH